MLKNAPDTSAKRVNYNMWAKKEVENEEENEESVRSVSLATQKSKLEFNLWNNGNDMNLKVGKL